MRLLQINPNGSDDAALDLHPMVTVLQNLGPEGRDLVLRLATALPRGLDPGVRGLVEAHGVLLDLDPDTLALLELHADVDTIVQRDDVPGLSGLPVERSAGTSGPGPGRAEIEAFIEATPVGELPELDKARKGRDDARDALDILREALDKARGSYEEVAAELRRSEAALEVARRTGPRLEFHEPSEDDSEEEAAEQRRQIRERRAAFTEEIATARERLASIERSLAELSSIDTRPIVVLLDAIKNPEPVELVPSARAQELADEFVELTKRVAKLEKALAAQGLDSGSAMRRLEDARQELAEAEKGMRKPELTPEDVAELEAAHEAVMEAEQKATGLRKRAGEKALEAARQREQEILDRVGFPTWTAYVMGASLMSIDHMAEQRVEEARAELEDAQAHWAHVCEVIESNPEYRQLLNRLEEVYLEAHDLLGGEEPDDLEVALRELQVPEREVTTQELADALAYQLELVGLDLGPSPSVDLTVMAAEAFFEEAQSVEGRIVELSEEKGQLEAAISVAEAELAELPELDGDDDGVEGVASDAGPEGDHGSTAEGGGLPGDDAEPVDDERIAELTTALDAAREEEAEYREWLESREALVDAALQVETVATARLMRVAADLMAAHGVPAVASESDDPAGAATIDLEAVEFYLLGRQAALREVSYAGSVPLVIDDALAGLDAASVREVMSKVDDLTDSVQILYLSDDPAVAAWAEEVGFARAAVVRAPAGFAADTR